jgi:steroid delta-isomerase-like uncharacterized protein
MSTEENKAIARRYIQDVWDKGDFDAEKELVADNIVQYLPGQPPAPGLEAHHQLLTMFLNAFPDWHGPLEDVIAEGDKVTTRWTFHGTHQGELFGIPATGKQVTLTGMGIYRIENGKIVELWTNFDQLGMLQQLGVVPAMA